MSIEARVGIFVLVALALLVGFILVLGDFRLTPGFVLKTDFAYAGGLQAGAPVKVGGITVGRVSELGLLAPSADPPPVVAHSGLGQGGRPVVRAELRLDHEVLFTTTESSQFAVATQGIMGEAYVEMLPGDPKDPRLVAGTAVRGVDAPQLHKMVLRAEILLASLQSLLGSSDGATASQAGRSLVELIDSVNSLLVDHRPALDNAITDLVAAAQEGRLAVVEIRQSLGGGDRLTSLLQGGQRVVTTLQERLPPLLIRADEALAAVERAVNTAHGAIEGAELAEALNDARTAAADLKELVHMGRSVMAQVQRGDGTVGGLVNDAQVYDDIKEMVRDLKRHPWKVFWRD